MSDEFDDIVDNLREPSAWIRVLLMIAFAVVLYLIIAPVIFVLMVAQALFALISGKDNRNLRYLGGALAQYVLQILHYLSYNSDVRPFPFSEFPALEDEVPEVHDADASAKDSAAPKTTQKKAAKKAPRKKTAKKKASVNKSKMSSEPDDDDQQAKE